MTETVNYSVTYATEEMDLMEDKGRYAINFIFLMLSEDSVSHFYSKAVVILEIQ